MSRHSMDEFFEALKFNLADGLVLKPFYKPVTQSKKITQ